MPTLQLAVFLNAIRLMASPASMQIQPGQVAAAEIALDWDNSWHLAKGLYEERVISLEIYNAVTQLHRELRAIEPSSTFWSDEALQHDDRWEGFRLRAQNILAHLAT